MTRDSFICWAVIVVVFRIFVGTWGAAIPVGIIVLIARIKWFIVDFRHYK